MRLMHLGERLGVEVDHSMKCHPELAGEGVNTLWAKQNQFTEEQG
jgi:hypothetical protein